MENNLNELDKEAEAAVGVGQQCQIASIYVKGLTDPDPESRERDKVQYEILRDKAAASALAIQDEYYRGFAINHVVKLCLSANDIDFAKLLLAPELAGKKVARKARDAVMRRGPPRPTTRALMAARLGNAFYWAGTSMAALIFAITMYLYWTNAFEYWGGYIALVAFSIGFYLIGRTIRYVLAGA